jgi:hypothetical protein
MPRHTPRSMPPPCACAGCSNIYVIHGHLRTTSDRQQQITEMAVNLIFEQYGMSEVIRAVECQTGGPLGCNVPTKVHGVTSQKNVILATASN